jgi:peptidoglycan/xylan/chitin deacetylase (PgdA/CDA1 family)
MSYAALAVGVLIALWAVPGATATEPTAPATPTGCATNVFDLEVRASPEWGVVPFRTHLSVSLKSRTDSIEMVWWDFEGDGMVEVAGREATCTFAEPVDHAVSVTVRTRERGNIELEKVVSCHTGIMSLTFDDGCKSVYNHGAPILAARGLAATAYIVPTWVKPLSGAYMSWDHIWELSTQGWDIGSHTMTHVSLEGVDDSTLHNELGQSQLELQAHGFDCVSFSLPHGAYDERALDAVKMYYESCRAVGLALNPPVEYADPYLLLSKTSQPWIQVETYMADIDSVASYGGWYILNNHRVWPDCNAMQWCIHTETLADLVDYALACRLRVANVRNVLEYRRTLEVNAQLPGGPGDNSQGNAPVEWAFANPLTLPGTIEFRLPAPAAADVRIYDCTGRYVTDLGRAGVERADHRVSWDGLNAEGKPVASGAYYCVVSASGEVHSSGPLLIVR